MPTTTRTLSEGDSADLVARHGVPMVPSRRAADAAAAVAAADALGYPAVVKLHGDAIAHKTERGLVRLRLGDAEGVAAAATELLDAAVPDDGAVDLLVAPMVSGSRELMAGLLVDAQFGPCVMVGIGGVLAEAIGDVVFQLAPVSPLDAAEMIGELRHQDLLGPCRGEPAVERAELASVLLALGAIASREPRVVSVDLNPLLVVGGHPIAVDALVEVAT